MKPYWNLERSFGLVELILSGLLGVTMSLLPARAAAQEYEPPHGRSGQVVPSEIRGTLRLNGFTGNATEIKVHAVPGGVASQDGVGRNPDPRAAERTARLTRTAEPGLFQFSIQGLHAHAAYQLAIEFPPTPVQPKVFLRGLVGGMAMSGGPPVALEGFVARTEVEIQDSQGAWVGADNLQFNNPDTALRTLRWKSDIPGVVGGELQISTRRFPIRGEFGACDEPEGGVIFRKQLASRGDEWQEIASLDFGAILRGGRIAPPDDRIPPGASALSEVSSTEVSTVSEKDLKLLALGAPLYLRVVPVTERGPACNIKEDGVHGWVILAKVRPPQVGNEPPPPSSPWNIKPVFQQYTPPSLPQWNDGLRHPNMGGDAAYYVTKEHKLPVCKSWQYGNKWCGQYPYDPVGQILVDIDRFPAGSVLNQGTLFSFVWIYTHKSCSGWCIVGEMFNGLVTGAFNGFGDLVTYLADQFEAIKDGVAGVLADVVTWLPGIGEACNVVSCKDVIKAGIEVGLASMGLPPSLPNWNELKDQGVDYLASEIATEMADSTGLPEAVTKLAADEVMNLTQDMAQKTVDAMSTKQGLDQGLGYDWFLPYSGMDPGVWTIWIQKRPEAKLMNNIYLSATGTANFSDIYLGNFWGNLYHSTSVHVPTQFPASNFIRLPVVLQPDFSTIPPPKCYWTPGYGYMCMPHPNPFNIPVCVTSDGYSPFKPVDCAPWSNYIGVYYRDYWIDQRWHQFMQCVNLQAYAFTPKSSIWDILQALTDPAYDPWLPYWPPFFDFARVGADKQQPWNGNIYLDPYCTN